MESFVHTVTFEESFAIKLGKLLTLHVDVAQKGGGRLVFRTGSSLHKEREKVELSPPTNNNYFNGMCLIWCWEYAPAEESLCIW